MIEGFEVAIAALVENLSICECYAEIYSRVSSDSQPNENQLELRTMLESALPELYAAVIVFSVKACAYFEAGGMF